MLWELPEQSANAKGVNDSIHEQMSNLRNTRFFGTSGKKNCQNPACVQRTLFLTSMEASCKLERRNKPSFRVTSSVQLPCTEPVAKGNK